jgi:transcriptional regulator with XRE-family HTH domain
VNGQVLADARARAFCGSTDYTARQVRSGQATGTADAAASRSREREAEATESGESEPSMFGQLAGAEISARPRAGKGGGETDVVERARLAGTLGALLRSLRAEAGMSRMVLARRSGVSAAGIECVENGSRRPSIAMLSALATGLTRTVPPIADPERKAVDLLARLTAAAGSSLVVDTIGGRRRRERGLAAGQRAWKHELRRWEADRAERFRQGERAWVRFMELLQPGAFADPEVFAECQRLQKVYTEDWLDAEGPRPMAGTTKEFRRLAAEFERGRSR